MSSNEELRRIIKEVMEKYVNGMMETIIREVNRAISEKETTKKHYVSYQNLATFLKALANEDRLKILFSLKAGSLYFSDLQSITGLGSGPLTHHLSRLQSEGLIIQERSRGKYVISPKGRRTLHFLENLMEVLENEMD